MIPLTPTPLPPDPVALGRAAQIDIGATTDLWDIAPNVLQLWGQFSNETQAVQWVLLAVIIVGLIWVLIILLKRLGAGDAGTDV